MPVVPVDQDGFALFEAIFGKPVVLAVNKADQVGRENPDIYEFYALGLGDPIEVSAVHGHGTGDLLDACFQYFPPSEEERTRRTM